MRRFVRNLLLFAVYFSLLVFTSAAYAAGSDFAGWSITSGDNLSGPFDLRDGDATSNSMLRPGIDVLDSGKAFKEGGSVRTNTNSTHAVRVSGADSSLDLTDVSIVTQGNTSYGLYVRNGAEVVMTGGGIETLSDLNTEPNATILGSHAVNVENNSSVTLNNVDIATRNGGTSAYGILTNSNNSRVVMNGGSISTTGLASVGLVVGGNGTFAQMNGVAITTEGNVAHAVDIRSVRSPSNASVSFDSCLITTNGDGADGIQIGGATNELYVKDSLIATNGENSSGVTAMDGAKVYLENTGIEVRDNGGNFFSALSVVTGGNITFKDSSFSVRTANDTAIRAIGGSATRTMVTGLGGVINILGGISASGNTLVDITMDDGSLFRGWTDYTSGDATTALNLTLNGSGTLWEVVANSNLKDLYMDGSTVDMTVADLGTEVFVLNLGRSADDTGVFRMNTDIVDEFADHLYVGGIAQGTYRIDVVNDGSLATVGTELTDLVYVEPGQPVVFILDHTVELGGFQYELIRPDMDTEAAFLTPRADHFANAWYLGGNGRASVAGSGAINSFAGSYLMAYAEMQTLIQRMGDLRQSPYRQGMWFRIHGGKFESSSKSYVRGFDMDYGGVQIGYDRKLENKWDGDIYVGAMFGYSRGDLDYHHEGSGEVDSMVLGLYGTYIARNGWYVDTVLKYQWMTNDFDVIDTAGTLVRGQDVDTGGIGASIEIGKRIHVGDGKENRQGWYVEPQIQLSYQHQDGGFFNATNGLRIGVDSFNSLLGRIGMLVGYETETTNLYAKVSQVKEFDGDLTIYANGIRIPESFGDNWWVYGIGCTSRINHKNSLYFEIERTSGGSFSQPWRVFAGWRVEF